MKQPRDPTLDTPGRGRVVLYRGVVPVAPVAPAVVIGHAELEGRVHLAVLTPETHLGGAHLTIAAHNVGEDDFDDGFYVEAEHTLGTWRWPTFR